MQYYPQLCYYPPQIKVRSQHWLMHCQNVIPSVTVLRILPLKKCQAIIAQGKQEPANLLARLGFKNVVINSVDDNDGLRITLSDERIIHLRPSGNAPELRCYAEAENYKYASVCVLNSLNNIQKL